MTCNPNISPVRSGEIVRVSAALCVNSTSNVRKKHPVTSTTFSGDSERGAVEDVPHSRGSLNSLGSLCEALRSERVRMRRAASERPRVYTASDATQQDQRPIEQTSLSALLESAWTASLMIMGAF